MKQLLIILLSFTVKLLLSQNNESIEIQQVDIVAKKPLHEIAKSTNKIDSLVVKETVNESMAELLSEHSTVFIKQAGRGSLATISFRGTSASHTDVLWNNISIKSPMLGQVDFSLIPVFFIDDIDVFSGGSSIEKSTGALGGSISLQNNPQWNDSGKVKLILSYGSFNSTQDFFQYNFFNKNFKSKTRIFLNYSKNNFKFKNKNIADIDPVTGEYIYPIQENINADYTQYGILQEFYYKTQSGINLSVKYWGQNNDRNLPRLNSFEGDDYANISNQKDKIHRLVFSADYYLNKTKISVVPAFVYQNMIFEQSNYISGLGYQNIIYSESYNKSSYNKLIIRHNFNQNTEFNFNASYNYDNVSNIDTVDNQGYTKQRNELILFASLNKKIGERFGFSLMAKKYFSPDNSMPLSPFAGIEYILSKKQNISVKANISRNYRNPDLNDLYWQPGGNPNLKPEENSSADLSVLVNKKYKKTYINTGLTAYYSDVNNWIIWLPSPFGYWTPYNIQHVISKGLEANLKFSTNIENIKLKFIVNYAFTSSKNYGKTSNWGDESYGKQLPYIPVHSFNFTGNIEYKNYGVTYVNNSYSERYTTSSNNTTIRDWLYPYYMNNISFYKNFRLKQNYKLSINLKIYNMFNEEYRSVLGRAMPGINYMFFVKLGF